jgi:hypothetical protein
VPCHCKDRHIEVSDIESNNVARFSGDYQVVFGLGMPLETLNVFVKLFVHKVGRCFFLLSYVLNVDPAIVAARGKDLLVVSVPSNCLHFVRVQRRVRSFALDVV